MYGIYFQHKKSDVEESGVGGYDEVELELNGAFSTFQLVCW